MPWRLNRRNFLRQTVRGGAGLVILAHGASARGYAANEKLHLAHVGVGGRGRQLLPAFAQQENSVALCDVNEKKAAGTYVRFPDLPKFHDFREGALGVVREVHVWNDQGGPDFPKPPEVEMEVPADLKWDLWLGPARERPFHPQWMAWHGWRDFGTGNLGNWASHTTNLAFMALKVDSLWNAAAGASPILRVEAEVSRINRWAFPRWEFVRWEVPARGDLPPVAFHWHNGSRRPGLREQLEGIMGRGLDWGDKGQKKWADWAGCLIVGTEGKIYTTAHNATFTMLPEEKFKDFNKDAPEKVDRSGGHERDWLLACRGGKPAWANFDYAGPLTEFNMLGNVATQFEGRLDYDPVAGKIVNNEQADQALTSEYRQDWSL